MSIAAVKIKIMPVSADVKINEVEKKVRNILKKNKVQNPQFEIQPIAFGLKALIVMFGWPEEKPLDGLEEQLKNIEIVNSVEIIDIRRAIG